MRVYNTHLYMYNFNVYAILDDLTLAPVFRIYFGVTSAALFIVIVYSALTAFYSKFCFFRFFFTV